MSLLSYASRFAFLALALTAACLPPERPASRATIAPPPVRVWERSATTPSTGVLVQLTADSVMWRPTTASPTRALPLTSVVRVEVAEPLSQRAAVKRGLVRGALVGGALGAGLIAIRPSAVGGAIGLTLGSAWLAGVISGQQVESPNPPMRWRVVHPRPEG